VANLNLPDPILVDTPAQLQELVAALSREPVIAVDTESNSLYAYRERVCLIQFSTPTADYLVDPLALEDLNPLAPVFADPQIEKIFHAAEYDVICLRRDFSFSFANLFDTMLAARIIGRRAFGLGAILQAEFGVQVNKRYQRANWGQRPLPPHLLAYAQVDTHYLIPLRDRLRAELEADGRWALAEEDFARTCLVEQRPANNLSEALWRINGAHELDPQQAAVLQELCRYREDVARSLDRPVFKVMNDQTLLAIAEALPSDGSALRRVQGMTAGRFREHEKGVLRALRRGLEADPLYPPKTTRPDGNFLTRLERLRQWRKTAARKMGVNSDVVLPRDLLFELAREAPSNPASLEALMAEVPWRRETFGGQILATLSKVNNTGRTRR
jgi:ribonuclease D